MIRKALGAVLACGGALLLLCGVSRWRLPYNEQGRFFDAEAGVVYHLQTAEVLTIAGVGLLLAGMLILLFVRRRPDVAH